MEFSNSSLSQTNSIPRRLNYYKILCFISLFWDIKREINKAIFVWRRIKKIYLTITINDWLSALVAYLTTKVSEWVINQTWVVIKEIKNYQTTTKCKFFTKITEFLPKFLLKLVTKIVLSLLFKSAPSFNWVVKRTWALNRTWALIKTFFTKTGCLFRLSAKSIIHGTHFWLGFPKMSNVWANFIFLSKYISVNVMPCR